MSENKKMSGDGDPGGEGLEFWPVCLFLLNCKLSSMPILDI